MPAPSASTPRAVFLIAARAALFLGPFVLAFFAGGYGPEPIAWGGLVAWVLVVAAATVAPVPRERAALLALGGLALLAAWTVASITWAPVAGDAYHAGQRALMYVGALLAAAMLLRTRGAQRAVEPALTAGALVVVCYGLSERLFPGLLHFARSQTAGGRLEQPLTYWNAMGELAALAFVLCARIAGDMSRPRGLRTAATAAAPPLGLGLYLTFSRGALYAGLTGLIVLVVLASRREQLRAIGMTVAAGVLAAVAGSPFGGVTGLSGSLGQRESQGAITFALLVLITALAAAAGWVAAGRRGTERLALPRRAPQIALAVILAGLALAIVLGAKETSHQTILGGGVSRLTTLRSDRYAYWNVALKAFSAEPIRGVGAGGWAVWWLRYRKIGGFARDAHSLPLQTMAELGLVGLALLAVLLAGIAWAARLAHRRAPELSAGLIAAVVVYFVHAPLDWDWQLPALTLVGLVLSGGVLALTEVRRAEPVREPEPALTAAA